MNSTVLLKKFYIENKEFVKAEEIKKNCEYLNLNYNNVLRYLISKKYILRIFKGIFYIRPLEELKFGKKKYSHLELVSKGLTQKGIKNWYFSFYTALKLNNATHEYFSIDYITSENLYRNKPINIDNHNFKFTKLKPDLLTFGIIENGFRYSDLEKTILDFIYIWIYNKKNKNRILADISEYKDAVAENKIRNYSKHYPKSVREIIEEKF